jgi:hypothetical protein
LAIKIFKTKGGEISFKVEIKDLKNFTKPFEYQKIGKYKIEIIGSRINSLKITSIFLD